LKYEVQKFIFLDPVQYKAFYFQYKVSLFFQSAATFNMLTGICNQKLMKSRENTTANPIFHITQVLITLEFGIGMIKRVCRGRKA